MPVLFDGISEQKGQLHGRTPWNQGVHVPAPARLFGQIETVRIMDSHTNSLTGEINLDNIKNYG